MTDLFSVCSSSCKISLHLTNQNKLIIHDISEPHYKITGHQCESICKVRLLMKMLFIWNKNSFWICRPLKLGKLHSLEVQGSYYPMSWHYIPEEHNPQLHHCISLEAHKTVIPYLCISLVSELQLVIMYNFKEQLVRGKDFTN